MPDRQGFSCCRIFGPVCARRKKHRVGKLPMNAKRKGIAGITACPNRVWAKSQQGIKSKPQTCAQSLKQKSSAANADQPAAGNGSVLHAQPSLQSAMRSKFRTPVKNHPLLIRSQAQSMEKVDPGTGPAARQKIKSGQFLVRTPSQKNMSNSLTFWGYVRCSEILPYARVFPPVRLRQTCNLLPVIPFGQHPQGPEPREFQCVF